MKLKLLPVALLICTSIFSQDRKILGRILDGETQKPIKNANVVILGTTSGAVSNHLGFFELTIDASKHKTIVVSHVGFKTSELPIPAEDRFKFSLEKEYISLRQLSLALYPTNIVTVPTSEAPKTNSNSDLIVIESNATFPNGIDNFYTFMGNYLVSQLRDFNKESFNINFSINAAGAAVEISISDSSELVKSTVLQAFNEMPSWTAATQRQNKVSQHFVLPVVWLAAPDVKSLDLKDLYGFVSSNIKYPTRALRMGVQGVVYVEFLISNSGKVLDINLFRDIGADCGDEVKRIIGAIPSEIIKSLHDKTNSVKFILPVCFGLNRPFKSQEYILKSEALILNEVDVIAIGIER